MQYKTIINYLTIERFDYSEDKINEELFKLTNKYGGQYIAVYYPDGIVYLFDYLSCIFHNRVAGEVIYSGCMHQDVFITEVLGDNSRMWLENA